MMYRNHREYGMRQTESDHEVLRSWLHGETGVESLRAWLRLMYA